MKQHVKTIKKPIDKYEIEGWTAWPGTGEGSFWFQGVYNMGLIPWQI